VFAFTRKTDYALVALACLAEETASENDHDPRLSARQIAERQAVPLPLLMNILKDLVGGGIVTSTRGSRGGYMLARPAGGIRVSEVIAATEGPVKVMACCEESEDTACQECSLVITCPITDSIRQLNDRINGFLYQVTLEDLMKDDLDRLPRASDRKGEK